MHTVVNRIIEVTPKGMLDREMPFSEYIESEKIKGLRDKLY